MVGQRRTRHHLQDVSWRLLAITALDESFFRVRLTGHTLERICLQAMAESAGARIVCDIAEQLKREVTIEPTGTS
jgi:hypothetical protein